jgi:homocysteine S-methyltransferase
VEPEASTSDPLESLLGDRPFAVLDGALATELERRGADLDDPLWSARCLLDQPELIRAVHADYFDAGADVATAATYQASFEGFARRGIAGAAAAALMRDAVALAREARDEFWSKPSNRAWADQAGSSDARSNRTSRPRPLVAASVGPYGAMLADGSEYRGAYAASERELAAFHRVRLAILCDAGADILAVETLPCLREALIVAELIEELAGPPAWISFSCPDGAHTAEGDEVADCAAALDGYARVAAIGVNCTAPVHVTRLLDRMRARTVKPLLAYPNAGQRYDALARGWIGPKDGTSFAAYAREWQRAGARLIGGCCGTTPADIRELSRLSRDWVPLRRG